MIKGIYSASSSLRPMMARLEVIANNLANVNSTGFKRDSVFLNVLKDAGAKQVQGQSELDGVEINQITDFSEGSFNQTNNTLDVAIKGHGFFVVDTPQGKRYTRNGNFKLSQDGTLVTQEGYTVQSSTGAIQLSEIERSTITGIRISEAGEIMSGAKMIGKLRVVDFDDLSKLKKEQGTLFTTKAPGKNIEGGSHNTTIKQGFLEESNVDGIEEMISMIEISRNFEASQRALQSQDLTLDKTMEVGRI